VADLYHESCAKVGTSRARLMCSYFHALSPTTSPGGAAQRAGQIRYYKECVIPAFRATPATRRRATAISSTWWRGAERAPEDLTENSVLLGSRRAIA
jgi:hypothetical protein